MTQSLDSANIHCSDDRGASRVGAAIAEGALDDEDEFSFDELSSKLGGIGTQSMIGAQEVSGNGDNQALGRKRDPFAQLNESCVISLAQSESDYGKVVQDG